MAEKTSSAGVVKDYIAKLPDGAVATLDELVKAVHAAGITKDPAQIYADVQSLASRRAIGRGTAPRTYCRLDGEAPDRPARAPRVADDGEAAAKPRRPKGRQLTFPDADVLAYIEEQLGQPVERNKTEDAFCAVLIQEFAGDYLLERATMVLKQKPSRWFTFKVAENVAVGFYR